MVQAESNNDIEVTAGVKDKDERAEAISALFSRSIASAALAMEMTSVC